MDEIKNIIENMDGDLKESYFKKYKEINLDFNRLTEEETNLLNVWLINDYLEEQINERKIDPFIVSFFSVESVTNESCALRILSSNRILNANVNGLRDLTPDKYFFGMVIFGKEEIKLDSRYYVELEDEDMELLSKITSQGDVYKPIDLFTETVLVRRVIERFLSPMNSLVGKYMMELRKTKSTAFFLHYSVHMSDLGQFSFNHSNSDFIFDLDYREYFLSEIKKGHFILEGEIEDFIFALANMFKKESLVNPRYREYYERVNDLKEDIFLFKKLQSEHTTIVSNKLINTLREHLDHGSRGFSKLASFSTLIMPMNNVMDMELTPKTKRLKADTIDRLLLEYNGYLIDEDGDRELLQFMMSILLNNDCASIDDNMLRLNKKIRYCINGDSSVTVAMILTWMFKKEVFEDFIKLKSIDYDQYFDLLIDAIKNNTIEEFYGLKYGERFVDILVPLGIVDRNLELTSLGEVYSIYLNNTRPGSVLTLR